MKIVKYTALGALVGLCSGLILSFFVGYRAVCSCGEIWLGSFFGCGDATCSDGCQKYTSDSDVQGCILFATLICTVIGGAYGTVQTLQDKKEDREAAELEQNAFAKKQRATWASDIMQKALNLDNTCTKNKSYDKPLVTTTYEANGQMTKIMNELIKVVEKQGKVDSLAEELSKEGGV